MIRILDLFHSSPSTSSKKIKSKPSPQPSPKPSPQPSPKPISKPSPQPSQKPISKPISQPSTQPSSFIVPPKYGPIRPPPPPSTPSTDSIPQNSEPPKMNPPPPLASLRSADLLTDQSPKIQPISNIQIELKNHQLALLRRCLNIEKYFIHRDKENYGILSDTTGAGKTYVALSLLWFIKQFYIQKDVPKKERSASLIVVPQNILSQWTESITNFSPDFQYKILTEYNDMISFQYSNDLLFEYDFLITTPLFYYHLSSTFQKLKYSLNRIFFDEIDSISNLLKIPMQSQFVWFISASFKANATGDYNIIPADLPYHTAQCDPNFIEMNIPLPPYLHFHYVFYHSIVDTLLPLFVSKPILQNIYQLIFQTSYTISLNKTDKKIIHEHFLFHPKSNHEYDFLLHRMQDYQLVLRLYPPMIQNLEEQIQTLASHTPIDPNTLEVIQTLQNEVQTKKNDVERSSHNYQKLESFKEEFHLCSLCFLSCLHSSDSSFYKTSCCSTSICMSCYENLSSSYQTCKICNQGFEKKDMKIENENSNEWEMYQQKKLHWDQLLNRSKEEFSILQKKFDEKKLNTELLFMKSKHSSKLNEIEQWILMNMTPTKKILFFSPSLDSFSSIESLFQKYQYKITAFDAGNVKDIDKILHQYKHGDLQVLFLSMEYMIYGMNLEFTDEILLLSPPEPSHFQQMIGRAQRMGRKSQLLVHSFYYVTEYKDYLLSDRSSRI